MATAWDRFIDLTGFNWSFKPNISQLFPEHYQMVGRLKQLVSNTAVTQQYGIHLPKQEMQVQPVVWEDSLEMELQPTPVFLPGKSHGQRGAWQATVHEIAKSQT